MKLLLKSKLKNFCHWALIAGLAFYLADVTTAVFQKTLEVSPKPVPCVVQQSPVVQQDSSRFVALLRKSAPATTKARSKDFSPRVTTLGPPPADLTLRGTVAGVGGTGLAMIEQGGRIQVVGTGESVSGMLVKAVDATSVRLEAGGRVVVLELLTGEKRVVGGARLPSEASVVRQSTNSEAILSQRELRGILDNPTNFAGKLALNSVIRNGEVVGMRVAIRDASHPLARLGIRSGDVVKSLNGIPLDGPEALTQVYRVLRNTSHLSFEVDRGGASQKVEITLEE